MSRQISISVFLNWRALLVIAALICLCVSNNVGVQFLPLPALTTQATPDVQLDQAGKVSHAPQALDQSFRVPMMVQSKKRAEREPRQSGELVAPASDRLRFPGTTAVAIESGYTACFFTSIKMAPGAGRAPPSLL